MNLDDFLKEEAFSKYKIGIEKIKDDLFLWILSEFEQM